VLSTLTRESDKLNGNGSLTARFEAASQSISDDADSASSPPEPKPNGRPPAEA
jgi:hypothetical protein